MRISWQPNSLVAASRHLEHAIGVASQPLPHVPVQGLPSAFQGLVARTVADDVHARQMVLSAAHQGRSQLHRVLVMGDGTGGARRRPSSPRVSFLAGLTSEVGQGFANVWDAVTTPYAVAQRHPIQRWGDRFRAALTGTRNVGGRPSYNLSDRIRNAFRQRPASGWKVPQWLRGDGARTFARAAGGVVRAINVGTTLSSFGTAMSAARSGDVGGVAYHGVKTVAGVLAFVPGPIGWVAAGVAVGFTVWENRRAIGDAVGSARRWAGDAARNTTQAIASNAKTFFRGAARLFG